MPSVSCCSVSLSSFARMQVVQGADAGASGSRLSEFTNASRQLRKEARRGEGARGRGTGAVAVFAAPLPSSSGLRLGSSSCFRLIGAQPEVVRVGERSLLVALAGQQSGTTWG